MVDCWIEYSRKNPKKLGQKHDIQFPGIKPGYYQHIAREPSTNNLVQSTLLSQKKHAEEQAEKEADIARYEKNSMLQIYEKHAAKRQFNRLVKEKVQKKIEAYEEQIEKRRQKLQELFCREERQYFYETVEKAQKQVDLVIEEKKRKLNLLKAKKEEERLAVVHQKRIDQYRDRCVQLRTTLAKKNLVESKNTQLIQAQENEARKGAERELDMLWHQLLMKDMKAKMEREEQEAIKAKLKQKDLLDTWHKQVEGKNFLRKQMERIANEEKLEMEKLTEQLRREEIDALDAKRRKRDGIAKDLLSQIAEHEMIMETRRREDNAYTEAFVKMAEIEMEKERQAIQDFTTQARKETAMYKNYLKELEQERKKEEQELDRLLDIHRKEIERKQDEARCKLVEAKRALQENVLQERAQQIVYKKQEAEQQLKLKEAENELLRMAFDQNERLQAESDRLEAEAIKQYRDDLKKQIEYNNLLREKERVELERQLQEGMKEEEKYRKIVNDMVSESAHSSQIHPFRRALESAHCP